MIGDRILKLRKEKEITQNQLAGMVGITAGAVSKWETGNSVPDISLLAPLARALGTTIDDLLSFTPELTEEDVKKLKQNLSSIFVNSGFQEGEDACRKLLKEYPNSNLLKFAVACLIQVYAMMCAADSEDLLQSRLEYTLSLLEAVAQSNEVKYIPHALYAIAGVHMILENYDKSEAVLKQLTETCIDPMPIYPMVLQKQGKAEEAELLCEQLLLKHITMGTAMLSTMAKIATDQGRQEDAFIYYKAMQGLQNIFQVGLHSGDYSLCKFYLGANQLQPAAKAFQTYVEGLLSTDYDYRNSSFLKNIKLEVGLEGQKAARMKMYQSHIHDTELMAMKGIPEYEAAIALLNSQLTETIA